MIRIPRLAFIAAVGGLALGASACSPSTPSPNAPAPTVNGATTNAPSAGPAPAAAGGRACALLTPDQAAAVLGAPVTATEQDQGVVETCRLRPADPTGGSVYVSVLSATPSDFDTAAANLPVAHTSVSGIGDKAAFAAGAGELIVLSGGHMISVIVVHKGVVFGGEAELRTLAAAALDRL
jgi:hypothetical protein